MVNDQNDRHQLEPMLFKTIENLRHINENKDTFPKRILADAGYWAYEKGLLHELFTVDNEDNWTAKRPQFCV